MEVRVERAEVAVDSPVPVVLVAENGTETELPAGRSRQPFRS